MPTNRRLGLLLGTLPERYRNEVVSFLEFSERDQSTRRSDVTQELLVSLAFFNAKELKPN